MTKFLFFLQLIIFSSYLSYLSLCKVHNYFDPNILFLDALREGDLETAREMMSSAKPGTIDVNFANKSGLTGFHEGATNNDLNILEYLVELGADLGAKDVDGWTPLHLSAQWEHVEGQLLVFSSFFFFFFFFFLFCS